MIKRQVWENKSNQQLCVTVPKDSGIKAGDIIGLEKGRITTIAYTFVVADLFHYGHLQVLQKASDIADLHICGVITDEGAESYRSRPVTNFSERKSIISNLNCVDRVVTQNGKDPTENLKKIHEEFPRAKIILVHGDDWGEVPGEKYIKEIHGEVFKPPYYKKLSPAKVLTSLTELSKDTKSFEESYLKLKNMAQMVSGRETSVVSTKANTLQSLQPILKKSKIEKIYVFTVNDWNNKKEEIINTIQTTFNSKKIVVRSSAINEDTFDSSMAGFFHSELNVLTNNSKSIENAVNTVTDSYTKKGFNDAYNQVLVQEQTENIVLSGVVFTRTLQKNAPYYAISYDDKTSKTDTITGGTENKTIYVARFAKPENYPNNLKCVIEAVKEIEHVIPQLSLDIEFAVNKNGETVIYQVRPMATGTSFSYDHENELKEKIKEMKTKFSIMNKDEHVAGQKTFFCDMPDWNPAEIIGNNPNHLDYSLYSHIIMDHIWHQARTSQGYTNVNPAKLMILFGNKPYVNVRNSFNSFIPADVNEQLREKLMSFYLDKLEKHPELQDKVEFEIVYTCYDLTFDKRMKELSDYGFNKSEISDFKEALINLTNNLVKNSPENIKDDKMLINKLLDSRKNNQNIDNTPKETARHIHHLLDNCKEFGTLPFSRLARLAFIGKIILKSLESEKIITRGFYDDFLNSINTVASQMNNDFNMLTSGKMNKEEFVNAYGHLRPGTYDITANRYDERPELLDTSKVKISNKLTKEFKINKKTHAKITKVFKKHGLQFTSEEFFWFIKEAIEQREFFKFEFTKNLSDAIKFITICGKNMDFSKEEMSHLDIHSILGLETTDEEHIKDAWKNLIKSRKQTKILNDMIILPPTIFSENDFDVIQFYETKPNFITNKTISGKCVKLTKIDNTNIPDLKDGIVFIENADPGFDWIFTKGIAGLVTKYGGVASHMSIRCAEFGIPAAIGCGALYDKLSESQKIVINSNSKKITPVGV